MGLIIVCVPCTDTEDFPEINDLETLLVNLDRGCPSKHRLDGKDPHSRDSKHDKEDGQDQPLSLSKNFYVVEKIDLSLRWWRRRIIPLGRGRIIWF
jgi:hypothetical protein